MTSAFVYGALRTPFGRFGGSLAGVRPDDLAATVIKAAVERSGVRPDAIDDVIMGAANQAGEDNRNVARMSALLAGLPVEVGGQTVNRLCGSGLQAINSAAHAIMVGDGDAFVATLRWVETPFVGTLTCRVDGGTMTVDGKLNVSFGPTEFQLSSEPMSQD